MSRNQNRNVGESVNAIDEGNLPAARKALSTAVHNLIGRTSTFIDDQPYWGDSLYVQLREALVTPQQKGTGAHAGSQPPVWIDAADLLREIDTAVEAWQPNAGVFDGDLSEEPTPETVRRLDLLDSRKWRPQDSNGVQQIADACVSWTVKIGQLLDPVAKWTLPNPCPACATSVVYRRDSGGESVRQPALQIGPLGCECQKCRTVWGPDLFVHLSRVLGYQLPEGVLE